MGDYDRKPMDPPSSFLRLKSKDESCRVRIGAAPYRELKVWPATPNEKPLGAELLAQLSKGQWETLLRDPNFNPTEVYHFAVIDRADGAAKVFTTTGGVYGKIRKYAQDAEWGDPKGYDLTITRTENPGKNYYEVTPSPNKSDLSAAELQKIDKLDLAKIVPAALPANAPQPDDIDNNVEPEPIPWLSPSTAAVAPAQPAQPAVDPTPPPKHPDTVIEDIGDEPVNLDDIPFN